MIQQNCIILGYGRAGKRHKLNAEKLGLKVFTYDPNVQDADFQDTNNIPWFHYDYAVIASPPNKHLEQINLLYENKIDKILCEKPLCSMDEKEYLNISPDLNILMAYNWYYNDQVQNIRYKSRNYRLFAEQSRILPEWGIENDHLPHDLFIIHYITSGITKINHVDLVKSDKHQEVYIEGTTNVGSFTISERVLIDQTPRMSKVNDIDLIPDPIMFDRMWENFIKGNYKPSLKVGIQVQNYLSEINDRLESKKGLLQ